METYDAPFFKTLSRNDTGRTGGHQGGVVIPKDLSIFFPHIMFGSGPTADQTILAELYDADSFIERVETRYQVQTWGGTRSGEHRLTRNLRPLLSRARAGDILRFERQVGETNRYRLTLIHHGSSKYQEFMRQSPNTQLGPATKDTPATKADFEAAEQSIISDLSKPFSPTEPDATVKLTIIQRGLRSELFQHDVRLAYERLCAVCKQGWATPSLLPEVEAAHIIPRRPNGSNDPRNGLALCRSHHWAFDKYLWTLKPDLTITVPNRVGVMKLNNSLKALAGRPLHLPKDPGIHPASLALDNHRQRVLEAWGE
ncbi:MAG: HNH endonuclease [Negativicutes bacterium]|nr:HNH endonuclease [Negativicutes bacterium]